MKIPDLYINEDLAEHWKVDESPESFNRFLNHVINSTNMFNYFYKAAISILKNYKDGGLIIADIGGGIGWTAAILSKFPQIKKIYVIDISDQRLERGKYILKHFKVDNDKIKFIKGHFTDFEIDEKVDIVIMHGAFHHVFIDDMELLFKKIRSIIKETKYLYEDYKNKKRLISNVPQLIISGEHYLTNIGFLKKVIKKIFVKKPHRSSKFPMGSEHERTLYEIKKIFKKNKVKAKYHFFEENNIKKKNSIIDRNLIYYFAEIKL